MPLTIRCQALVFDLDGTLVDSTAPIERAWRAWAFARDVDPDLVLKVMWGRPASDVIREMAPWLDDADVAADDAALLAGQVGDTVGLAATPGALELLTSLPVDRWAVATSANRPIAQERLRACGLPVPPVIAVVDDVVHGKPAPDVFLLAAERLGVAATDCVVVEDSPSGLVGGQAAGMGTIALTTTHAPSQLPPVDVVVETPAALRASSVDGMLVVVADPLVA